MHDDWHRTRPPGFGFPHHPHVFRRNYWGGYWGPVYYGGYIPFDYDYDSPGIHRLRPRNISIFSLCRISLCRLSVSFGLCAAGRTIIHPRLPLLPRTQAIRPRLSRAFPRPPSPPPPPEAPSPPMDRRTSPSLPCWCFATATSRRWTTTPSWGRRCSCFPAGAAHTHRRTGRAGDHPPERKPRFGVSHT